MNSRFLRPDDDPRDFPTEGYAPGECVWFMKDGELLPHVVFGQSPNTTWRRIIWAPFPGSQQAVLQCPLFEVLYCGTRGPGKTQTMLMDFAQHIGQFGPDWRGVIFRQSFPMLSDIVAKTRKTFTALFPDASFNEQKMQWRWPGGEELLLRHMENPSDYYAFHGHAYPFIGWEELTTWPDDQCYRMMMSCSRSARPGMPRKYRATTNPYGVGHNWVRSRFNINKLPPGQFISPPVTVPGEPKRVAIHGSLKENLVLMYSDPEYVEKLRIAARNPAELAAWEEGTWEIVSGGMFDDVWDSRIHIIGQINTKNKALRLSRSFDWGSSRPFSVGWWAEVMEDITIPTLFSGQFPQSRSFRRGDLIRVNEWYGFTGTPNEGLRMPAREIAEGIRDRERRWFPGQRVNAGPADNAIFDKINTNSIAEDMEAVGVHWSRADKSAGSRRLGWEKLRAMMKAAKNPERTEPGLFVTDNCAQFIRTVPSLPRDPSDMDDVNTAAEDHIGDEVRYRVFSRAMRFQEKVLLGR
jgi:hypothetical protein